MVQDTNEYLASLEWRKATYNYKPIGNWLVSENGILYNPFTKEVRYGHDNVKNKDKHQRISIKHKLYYISRIVAAAFVENDDKERNIVVRHLDDNPLNNHYSNLKWGTHRENTYDAIRNGNIVYDENRKYAYGETSPLAVLKNEDVKIIIGLLNKKVQLKNIAIRFNVDVDVIRHIYKGKSWRFLTEKYLPFPEQELKRKPMSKKLKKEIIEYIKENPNAKATEICLVLGIEKNNTHKTFIGNIRRANKL